MAFIQTLLVQIKELFPSILYWMVLPLIPFMLAERIWPIDKPPPLLEYLTNVLIGLSATILTLPFGIAAGFWSAQLRHILPWKPLSFTFASLSAIPGIGHTLEIVAMVLVPLFLHDFWYYWSHRLEHRVPFLWAFHRIHHSDRRMNTSTWARDHFLQNSWRAFFSVFTLGLVVDLDLTEAGKAALYSNIFLVALSMFYHSAIRVELPWLNRVLVTPQFHRIHHSIDPAHYNVNFVDALPIFDIVFGTYLCPVKGEFSKTGLTDFPPPRSFWSAQFAPLLVVVKRLLLKPQSNISD